MVNELLGGATQSWKRLTTCLEEQRLGRTLTVVTKRWIYSRLQNDALSNSLDFHMYELNNFRLSAQSVKIFVPILCRFRQGWSLTITWCLALILQNSYVPIVKVCWWAYDHILQVHQSRVRPPLEGIIFLKTVQRRNRERIITVDPSKDKTMTGVRTSPEVCAQVGQLLLDPKRPLKERWLC